jgi:hypothetical protein
MYRILKRGAVAEQCTTSESKNGRRVKKRSDDIQGGTTGIRALNKFSGIERSVKNSLDHERAIF